MADRDWRNYYDAVKDEPPHRTLLEALSLIELEGAGPRASRPRGTSVLSAIDLGCGSGRDSLELLRRGWQVLAVDIEAEGLARLRAACPPEAAPRLKTLHSALESVILPTADLVNASLSLPFVRPASFDSVWEKIRSAIRPGGWFSGHFFGVRDEWASRGDITTLTDEEIRQMFASFEFKSFAEMEEDGVTIHNRPKHWHRYSIVARRKEP